VTRLQYAAVRGVNNQAGEVVGVHAQLSNLRRRSGSTAGVLWASHYLPSMSRGPKHPGISALPRARNRATNQPSRSDTAGNVGTVPEVETAP